MATKELDLVVANGLEPQLTLLTVDPNGRVRQSSPTAIPIKPVDWAIDFQLPERVRVGEELVVDVGLTNRFQNCSQVSGGLFCALAVVLSLALSSHFHFQSDPNSGSFRLIDPAANGFDRWRRFCRQRQKVSPATGVSSSKVEVRLPRRHPR